jgi:uncharacterized membrane protein
MSGYRALLAIALATSTALLAGCGSSPASPSSARALILKVPGCSKPYAPSGGVAVQAQNELECRATHATVDLATFTSSGQETAWITAQNAGTCETIQGHGWAAMLYPSVTDYCGLAAKVVKAVGGRVVSG